MKNSRTKKSFDKFSKRNTHKRKSKARAGAELMRAIAETGVGTDALKLTYSNDRGRRGRVSDKIRKDERVARGVFSSSKSGFGFVSTDDGYERDIFIPEAKTLGAIDGDLVEIIYHVYKTHLGEEKTEGRVKKIVEFGRKTVIGTLAFDSGWRSYKKHTPRKMKLLPDDKKLLLEPTVTDAAGAAEGDKVEALIVRTPGREVECTVIRSFGRAETKEANYAAILAESEIPVDFSESELAEAEFFAALPISDEGRVRRDREVIFTIDGEGAKDLDDAVSLKRLKGGCWQLGVHIADVSYYVREKTHLDRAVMARGTSVYFTDKVVPMLPPALSNGICSLNAGEEKYTLSAIINLSPVGEILSCKIEPSIIKSRVRGVYSEVNRIFFGDADKAILEKYKDVIPSLMRMHELYLVLKRKSEKRGALELETPEAQIILDKSGAPVSIERRERGDGEKLIEQFMLCANEAVAVLLSEKGIPCVFRVHEAPPMEKLSEFLTFAHNLGFDTSYISREKSSPGDFARLLSEAAERGILAPVSYSMLRSMAKAKYSDVRGSHFGLGIELYCHFTSPIRRLSDLATHRIIHKVLIEDKKPMYYSGYARRAAAAATEAELRALNAERRIENLYKVIYMSKFIGEEFDGIVSSVNSFGFFAELENTCEGLVPISDLCGMYFFDEKNLSLRSRDNSYHLGDRVRIRLEEADIIRGKLRFSVVDDCIF
jgi:ribonuclease R